MDGAFFADDFYQKSAAMVEVDGEHQLTRVDKSALPLREAAQLSIDT
jgi:hypothetical protein